MYSVIAVDKNFEGRLSAHNGTLQPSMIRFSSFHR